MKKLALIGTFCHTQEQLNTLKNTILEWKKINVDTSKIFLLGFSQGAILSYGLSLTTKKVQHVIVLSGYLNEDLIQPDNVNCSADYFISHGTVDQVIPVEWARNTSPFLETLKLQNEYLEYPVGHGVSPQNFFSFKKWIENRL